MDCHLNIPIIKVYMTVVTKLNSRNMLNLVSGFFSCMKYVRAPLVASARGIVMISVMV